MRSNEYSYLFNLRSAVTHAKAIKVNVVLYKIDAAARVVVANSFVVGEEEILKYVLSVLEAAYALP